MASLRRSINAFCRSCIYDPGGGGGTWREQVEACTSQDCPLYEVRPISSGKRAKSSRSAANEAPNAEQGQ